MRYIFALLLVTAVAVVGHTSKQALALSINQDSPAGAIARAHVEAWSNHNWDKARKSLAVDVHVTATTTQPTMAATDLTGIDNYMTHSRTIQQSMEAMGSMMNVTREQVMARIASLTMLKVTASVSDTAKAAAFVASDKARMMTANVINSTGGVVED